MLIDFYILKVIAYYIASHYPSLLTAPLAKGANPQEQFFHNYLEPLIPLLVIIVGGVLTYFLAPWIQEKFKLRADFFVDYKKWCTSLYGELREYEYLCENLGDFERKKNYNYLVMHFWEFHRHISRGHEFMGKVHKKSHGFLGRKKYDHDLFGRTPYDKHVAFEDLLGFINRMDKNWHQLENDNPKLSGPILEERDLRLKLESKCADSITEADLQKMGLEIIKDIKNDEIYQEIECEIRKHGRKSRVWRKRTRIRKMERFLEEEIP
jgi:hypothetical protein